MPINPKQTGKAAASAASRALKKPSTLKRIKKIAASDLAQAPFKKKPKAK